MRWRAEQSNLSGGRDLLEAAMLFAGTAVI